MFEVLWNMFTIRRLLLNSNSLNHIILKDSVYNLKKVSNIGGVFKSSKHLVHSSMNGTQSTKSEDNLVWIDMEMTGLDPVKDHVIEVACLITNGNLDIIAEQPSLIIHHPDHVLNSMNEWSMKFHNESGLVTASQQSKLSLQEVESRIHEFVKKYTPAGKCPLAGNSVYIDRLFLRQHMPLVENHLHYRIVDVSTVKELCRRWYPDKFNEAPGKVFCHRALSDIKESIKELLYYRMAVFHPTIKTGEPVTKDYSQHQKKWVD